ncbi:MAG: DUF512 domain-containing protein, partial [Cyanobacteria bacterium J06639_1]
GSTFAWLADEWFLIAGRDLPAAEDYEDYPQLANGVGSIRQFLTEFDRAAERLPDRLPAPMWITWVVGNSVEQAFQPIVDRFNRIENVKFEMIAIASSFWGQAMTVTGLLTGKDILRALSDRECGDLLLLPSVTLKDGEKFLDDVTVEDLRSTLGIPIELVGGGAEAIVQAIARAPRAKLRGA